MFKIDSGHLSPRGREPSRRDFLRVGALALGGLTLGDLLRVRACAQPATAPARAKSVIQLWMAGGPPHLDTFDPKPKAGEPYCGPLRHPIATNVDGIIISELLPQLAKQADKYTILRGMTQPFNGHETATYTMQTGTLPGEWVYPSLGAVVSLKKGYDAGYRGDLPPYISLTTTLGRFSESGFLGSKYKPFATGGDPHLHNFAVEGLSSMPGVDADRMNRRRSLLDVVDGIARDMQDDKSMQTMDRYGQQAYGLIFGQARQAFDLSQEKEDLRDRYGRTRFGQSCLAARRLVERGVPFVTVNMGGWDTHRDNFGQLKTLAPALDNGFATLLADLAERGLLESTIVLWYGEFGRTPKVNTDPPWVGGRHHYNVAFSSVVAGGGFAGGRVVGETDARGEHVLKRPVNPWDLTASIYRLMGIDPHGELPNPQGCVAHVTPPGKVSESSMLTEIMS